MALGRGRLRAARTARRGRAPRRRMATRTPQAGARRPSRPAARLHPRRRPPRDLSPAEPAAARLGRKQGGRSLRPAGAPEAGFSAMPCLRRAQNSASGGLPVAFRAGQAVWLCFQHSCTRMVSPGRSSAMLAAATSSRPAVTRRAYECGGADTDVESIATDSPAMRSGTARAAGDAWPAAAGSSPTQRGVVLSGSRGAPGVGR